MKKHYPVLYKEILNIAKDSRSKIIVDTTLGGGGHSLKLLEVESLTKLVCFDYDSEAIYSFEEQLDSKGFKKNKAVFEKDNKKVFLINSNFENLGLELSKLDIDQVDLILADLGWSIDQLEEVSGLSYKKDTDELDMRLNKNLGVKASDLLNVLNKKQLEKMFSDYGDLKKLDANKMAKEVINSRREKEFKKVSDIKKIIFKIFGNNTKELKTVFQSLRIAVNNEYQNIRSLIQESRKVLNVNGKLLVLTFHSGEERIIKNNLEGFRILKDPIRPSISELRENLASRSAKLWILEKQSER